MSGIWQSELSLAREAAKAAGGLLAGVVPRLEDANTKSNKHDLVTEWDLRLESEIREALASSGIPVLGEEQGLSDQEKQDSRWLVDPIDGTVNFAHGLPFFAVSIALEHHKTPVVAVTLAPALGWEFYASKGGGAFFGSERMAVSQVSTVSESMLASGFPYDRAETRHNFAEWERFQCAASACRRVGAASLDLAMVARGWFDGYWESRLSPWDVSAGALLVTEAGGRVSSLSGSDFCSDTGEAVASNGLIHDEIIRELRNVS